MRHRSRTKERFHTILVRNALGQRIVDNLWSQRSNPEYFRKVRERDELLDRIIATNKRRLKREQCRAMGIDYVPMKTVSLLSAMELKYRMIPSYYSPKESAISC